LAPPPISISSAPNNVNLVNKVHPMTRSQYAVIHKYAKAAGLGEAEYRQTLKDATGKVSSKGMTNAQFDRAMATIEARLFDRVAAGKVPDPDWIQNEYHWRQRLPRDGFANTRLTHRLRELWNLLQDYLTTDHRTDAYLAAIIEKASGRPIPDLLQGGSLSWTAIPATSASLAITALQDRLTHAVKGAA
jgi:hypothetical protein